MKINKLLSAISFLIWVSYFFVPRNLHVKAYSDDSLFYSIISNNFLDGKLFSFDAGVSVTNGFHWLNMIFVLSCSYFIKSIFIINHYSELLINQYYADAAILALVTFFTSALIVKNVNHFSNIFMILLLTISISQCLALGFGMETVFLPLLLVYHINILNRSSKNRLQYFLITLLTVLCRIDFLIFSALIIFSGYVFKKNILPKKYLISEIAGLLSGLFIILIINYLSADNVISSSMLVKSAYLKFSLNEFLTNISNLSEYFIVYTISFVFVFKVTKLKTFLNITCLITGFCNLIYVALQNSFGGNNNGSWYDVVWQTFLIIEILVIADYFININLRKQYLIFASLILVVVLLVPRENIKLRFWYIKDTEYDSFLLKSAEEIEARTKKSDVLAVDDLPGRFTYYTNRNIVSLDGLVNSPYYVNKYLKQARIENYINNKVGYVILLLDKHGLNGLKKKYSSTENSNQMYVGKIGYNFNKNFPKSEFTFDESQIIYCNQTDNFGMCLIKVF